MGSRMEKYNCTSDIPKRSERNQELYKQIYNAYDEFENLIIPSNTREIDLNELKREVSGRDDYRKVKDYSNITNNKVIRKEVIREEQKKENEIYDINQLLDKAVSLNKNDDEVVNTLSNKDYLKKLNLDKIEDISEFEDLSLDMEEDEEDSLLKTANLSLEILSDLKGENENTLVSDPVSLELDISEDDNNDSFSLEEENDEQEETDEEDDKEFYTGKCKFKKDDFDEEDDDEEDDNEEEKGHFFLKTFLLVFGIILVICVILYLISYFGRS